MIRVVVDCRNNDFWNVMVLSRLRNFENGASGHMIARFH
jgi:hypothetical protein